MAKNILQSSSRPKKALGSAFAFLLLTGLCGSALAENSYFLKSPDGTIVAEIVADDGLMYEVSVDGKVALESSRIDMVLNGRAVTEGKDVMDTERRSVSRVIEPLLPTKNSMIEESFNEIKLRYDNNVSIVFRAYDEGVAYRFETGIPDPVTVDGEILNFSFPAGSRSYYPFEEGYYSHNERTYVHLPLNDIKKGELASLPALVEANGTTLILAESDLRDYPGLWLRGTGGNALEGDHPKYPKSKEMEPGSDRNEPITDREEYLAKTEGSRTYPWRILGVAKTDADLLTNQLVYQLASPSALEDDSWIKPGKVAWDWYNANNLYDVDFKAGINTETYKYYIDFASKYGLEYVILDEGWYPLGDLMATSENMDIEEIVSYGKKKGVEIVLWVVWKTLDTQFEKAMDRFEELGVAGIKVDFMQRDDQEMVNFYWRVAEEAAKRHLLVNLHGSYKPAGLQRTYPNAITREGVKGLEWNKWSEESTPEHNVTLPFTRMVAGPMDYTPGAMVNAQKRNFRDIHERPMSMTTRVHQMAMFSIFESPMQMLADSPSNYLKEPEVTRFLSKVPTIWDETRVLEASIGNYVIMARRRGEQWFIGAMTDEEPREFQLELDFLGDGSYRMTSFSDGVNADRWASDHQKNEKEVTRGTSLKLDLAPSGGWTARIEPKG